MSCNEWNDQWVARIYDELEPEEERRLQLHLDSCAECRRTLDELQESRRLLRHSAPSIPAGSGVVVLQPSGFRLPVWAIASGLAAALLVFASGLFVGYRATGEGAARTTAELEARLDDESRTRSALEARLTALEDDLATAADAGRGQTAATENQPEQLEAVVTRDEFDRAFGQFAEQMRVRQARDMEFLLDEMTTIERRAAQWTDETREAVRLVAIQQDPRYRER